MFTQNKSVAFWGSQAFWSGADVANSSFNANIIENNRIYNYTASPQPYAAIMIYGGNGNFLHQNISEGGGPKYHVILDQQNNSGGLVTTVDGLWVESNGISPSVDLWFNKAQYNTYVKDVHVIYPDTLFKFTNTHGGAQFYFDIPYLGALSSVPFISDGVTLNYGVLISVAPSNSGSASSLFDLLNTSSKWSNGVVFCLMQQLGDLKTDGVHIKSNYPFTINPNSGSPSVNDRPLTIDGTLSFSTDNLASIGGKEGYLNERPKALYLGNHATTDVSGYFGWGDAVSNYDAAHTDLYLYRISSGTLGVYGSNGMSANSYKTFANTSSNQRFTISPGYSNRPNAGIWYENIIANGDTNAIVSLGHNWDNSKTNDGYIRVGLEQKYSPFPGATYRNKEAHLPEVKLTNGTIYRPGSWTGRDDQLSGNWDWRASTYNFFQADVDSLQFGIGNGATVYTPTGGGFYIRHHRMSPSYYGGLYADSVYNYLTLVSTFTNGLQVNSTKTNFTGRIYNNNSYGSDIAIGGDITLEGGQFSANPVNLRFAPSNSLNLAGWKVSTDYMALGINGSSSTFGNDGTRQGIEMLMDTRQGTADPLRIFVHPIGSTQYDALHITNVGKIQFPQYSSSVSGTATYNLSVDASGNVITTSVPLSNSASLNFPSTSAQNSSDLTITVTGAALNDLVVLGVPNGSVNANTCYTAWVSATNTVTVRFNNYSSGAIDPASGTFNVRILK
jgi:hypothetical protein